MDELKKDVYENAIPDFPDCSCELEPQEDKDAVVINYAVKETRDSFIIILINPSPFTLQHMALDGMALAGALLLEKGFSLEQITKKKIKIHIQT